MLDHEIGNAAADRTPTFRSGRSAFTLRNRFVNPVRSQQCLPSAEADSKAEINGLDAGLKASSTRSLLAFEFFSSLFSRRRAGAPEEARVFWRNRTPSFRLG